MSATVVQAWDFLFEVIIIMKTLRECIATNEKVSDYILFSLLKSNDVLVEKQSIMSEFESVLNEYIKATVDAKLNWISSHGIGIEYDSDTHEVSVPDWSEVFYEDID